MRLFAALFLCSTTVVAAPVGLYPLQLPHGDAQLAAQLGAQLHEPANGTLLRALEPSACAPDEEVCLAAAARHAGVAVVTTAAVDATERGYKLHVRAYAADQKLLGEWQGEVQGGSAELGVALQRGVCESLGAVCSSEVSPVPREALDLSLELSVAQSRSRVELTLFSGGLGLLAAAAGVGLYAQVAQSAPSRTALTATHGSHSAGIFAIALAATGAGAIVAGGLIVALTPESATLQARF